LFFTVPHFAAAQTFLLNIGLGTSFGMEFAKNITDTTDDGLVLGATRYYHNENYYTESRLDAYVTFDLRFIEAQIGFWWGHRSISTQYEATWKPGTNVNTGKLLNEGTMGGWLWSIYLKMPYLGNFYGRMWFPIVGIESRRVDRVSPGDNADINIFVDNHQTWNNFWCKFGIGFDRPRILSTRGFHRTEFLLGLRGNNEYEKELKKIDGSGVFGVPISLSLKFTSYYFNGFPQDSAY
jgi:hypothetical protein